MFTARNRPVGYIGQSSSAVPNSKELDPLKINFVTKISVKFIPSQEIVTVHSPGINVSFCQIYFVYASVYFYYRVATSTTYGYLVKFARSILLFVKKIRQFHKSNIFPSLYYLMSKRVFVWFWYAS